MRIRNALAPAAAALALLWAAQAAADIRVGITLSATGPAAALGGPMKNSVALLPPELAGHKVEYIVLDDATDGTRAVANARKLITENNVDVLVGSSVAPTSFPLIDIAAENRIPLISTTASARMVEPMDDKRKWVFKVVQHDSLMARAVADHMAKAGVRTVGFIGFNDAYGDGWYAEFEKAAQPHGIRILAREAYARADTSVTGQTLKLIAARPDVVLVAASGTPAVLPQRALRERGFRNQIYQTHGISTKEFIQLGGKDVEGTIFPAGPIVVAEQLPDDNPIKEVALDYISRYEKMYGTSFAAFGAHVTDTMRLLGRAVPVALARAQPGTPEFRAALRDALEGEQEVVMSHGIASMTPSDHNGFDERARVMVRIENGAWKLMK